MLNVLRKGSLERMEKAAYLSFDGSKHNSYSVKIKYLLVFALFLFFQSHIQFDACAKEKLEGGLKFSSYEQTKDLRTGLNLTVHEPLRINELFEIEFGFSFWRLTEAYGHVFRVTDQDGTNIDLISSPYSSKLKDLTLVIGDKPTSIDYSFNEIGLSVGLWKKCKLSIDQSKKVISLNINGIEKKQHIQNDLESVQIAFGKTNLGSFNISDVPPMAIRNVQISNNEELIRQWPMLRYLKNYTYDELNGHAAQATNPNWIINDHSKWILSESIDTETRPQISFDGKDNIYLLTSSRLYNHNLSTEGTNVRELQNQTKTPNTQSSLYMNDIDEIWVFDLDSLAVNKLRLSDTTWYEIQSKFSEDPSHQHSNKIISDGTPKFFGGYGHYLYQNDFIQLNRGGWSRDTINEIEPRYLSAMGQNGKGDMLIFGGYGSKSGSQEVGPRPFYQLHLFDAKNHSSTKLWELEDDETFDVFSNSMVIDSGDSIFYVLRYPKDKYSCKVVLDSYNIYSKQRTTFSDSLSFNFLDVSSYVDLLHDKNRNQLLAVLLSENDNGYSTKIYRLNFPPITMESIYQIPPKQTSKNTYLWITLCVLAFGGVLLIYVRRGKNESTKAPAPEPPVTSISSNFEDSKSAIVLMGGFQIVDKTGTDISEKFTATLRMLLALILLHSVNKGKGVSSTFIWETIWGDKPENKARNNRNVNIKKLRGLLNEVGSIEIKNNGDKWQIDLGEEVFFDYGYIQERISNGIKLSSKELRLVKKGNILPAMENDWIDPFKAKFSNQLVDNLLSLSKEFKHVDEIQNDIADSIFTHDIINQDALEIKIRYLNSNHKFALAKQCYESYIKEYKTLYDEDFDISFESLIHSN